MSFLKKVIKVAKDAGTVIATKIEESANETREIKQKLEGLEDDALLRIIHGDGFFSKSNKEKSIAFSILKSRGYDQETINSLKS